MWIVKRRLQSKNRPKKTQANPLEPAYKQQSKSLFSSLKSEATRSAFSALKSSESADSDFNLGDVQSAYTSRSLDPILASDSKVLDGLPSAPQDLKAPIVKARFVTLSWKPPLENAEIIQAYSIYYRQEGSDR